MKQRVRLSLAFLSDVELLLLDEPCSNLDENGMKWYRQLIGQYSKNRTTVVCSNNHPEEFDFCPRQINLMDWKH
jgi:ABC-type multidrug transport system ATPase subunit